MNILSPALSSRTHFTKNKPCAKLFREAEKMIKKNI